MNVLLVDDHPLIREIFPAMLSQAVPQATLRSATDLEGALEIVEHGPKPDLVLLDLGLPGCTGLDALRRFRERYPGLRVAVISAQEEADAMLHAFREGAVGYIPKTSPPKVIVAALQMLAGGGRYIPSEAVGGIPV